MSKDPEFSKRSRKNVHFAVNYAGFLPKSYPDGAHTQKGSEPLAEKSPTVKKTLKKQPSKRFGAQNSRTRLNPLMRLRKNSTYVLKIAGFIYG
jgi:hypothetical protein